MSPLQKYVLEPGHAIVNELIEVTKDLGGKEHPLQIVGSRVK